KVPSAIFRLFQAVIDARTTTFNEFQKVAAATNNADIEKSNATHKFFVDNLVEAFETLGGKSWKPEEGKSDRPHGNGGCRDTDDDLKPLSFSNLFEALNLDGTKENHNGYDGEDPSDNETQPTFPGPRRRQQRRSSKGKARRGKKTRGKNTKPVKAEMSLDDLSLERYLLILDKDDLVFDRHLAAREMFFTWSSLRSYVQPLWHEVAYSGLNSAVAATVSNLAISVMRTFMLKTSANFPDHDSYEMVLKAVVLSDRGNNCSNLTFRYMRSKDVLRPSEEYGDREDSKDQFMINTYRDLLDFVADFQKTRTGKPTKRMLREIKNWIPNIDLQTATENQRLAWRRAYTINWLYNLVNVYSSPVIQQRSAGNESLVLDLVDWSKNGPCGVHPALYEFGEFASFITSLAMQKPGTDIRKRILPYHVLELQFIVDSMTASRGWYIAINRNRFSSSPPDFRPMRDFTLFLGHKETPFVLGFLPAIDSLTDTLNMELSKQGLTTQREFLFFRRRIKEFQSGLVNRLGKAKHVLGSTKIPSSRFADTNPNSLWEYSPFLCGVGLAGALSGVYNFGVFALDMTPQPLFIVHLYNMLVQKGYIERHIGIFKALQDRFTRVWFADGKIPTSRFLKALFQRLKQCPCRRQNIRMQLRGQNHDPMLCRKRKLRATSSKIRLYHSVDWDAMKLILKNNMADPSLARKHMAEEPGINSEEMTEQPEILQREQAQSLTNEIRFLDYLTSELLSDVCGDLPLSGLNYFWLLEKIISWFKQVEAKLSVQKIEPICVRERRMARIPY
ncbi:hypothetical protein B0T26DRAFT_782508, partial [Lasiosphaeria miniovina]